MRLDAPLWRQTPLAIFPATLGFLGLALGWHKAANVLPWLSEDFGNLMLAFAAAFYLWYFLFYAAKLMRRPSVIMDDLKIPPARGGIAAMAMAMMLLAAGLMPFGIYVPLVWWAGVVMQIFASIVVLIAIYRDSPEKRHFSTFQYLAFVGPIVGPIAGIPLGFATISLWMTWAALVAWVVITAGLLLTVKPAKMPPPMRPSLAIALAPLSLFALSFGSLGYDTLYTIFHLACTIGFVVLVVSFRWMIKAGFTPIWGAFTFPIAAFLNVQVMDVAKGGGLMAEIGVYAGMILGTPLILFICYRLIMLCVTGELSKKSGAATV